jgi:hypothetical protein
MPGPRRFIRRIADDIEEGRNVIVAMPAPMSDGRWGRRLADARVTRIRDCLPTADIRTCPRPLDVIARHLLPREMDVLGLDLRAACDHAAAAFEASSAAGCHQGLTVAVLECGRDWPAWPAWGSFLAEWARASRNKDIGGRIVFVAIVGGVPLQSLPKEEESLRIRAWNAVSSDTDMLTHAHLAFADWSGSPLQRRVAASVAASLAVWDPEVVNALALATLDEILVPQPILRRVGQSRGWSASSLAKRCSWEEGHRGTTDYGVKLHSSVLALSGDSVNVASRVWAGQVGVLLPMVEELRLRVIGELGTLLRIPWQTRYEDIMDARDLEIAHLCDQVEMLRLPLRPNLRAALPILRKVRNDLAHLHVVDAATLRDERLGEALESADNGK